MALTTRNVFTPSGQGYFTPDGRPLAGVEIKFTLVATGTTRPVSPFDATSGARVAAVTTTLTDAAGEFSINLWPNDRGANVSTEYICHIGNGHSDFRAALPSSGTPIEWLDFQALGTALTPAEVSALATHIADTTVHLVPSLDNALKIPRITADGTNVEYVVGGGGGGGGGGGSGDVVGPASATDNAVVRFDGATGKLVQNSAVTIADTTGDITAGKYNTVAITGSGTPSLTVTGTAAVSGTNTGDQINISGNAATVTTNANMTGDVTSVGNATSIAAGVIVDADINASADIAVSKLAAVTASRALVSDVSGKVSASSVNSTELGYLSGVTSAIQTQLGNKLGTTLTSGQVLVGNVSNVATAVTPTGDVTISNAGVTSIAAGVIVDADINASADIAVSKLAAVTASRALVSDVSGKVSASSVNSTELGYLSGVTSTVLDGAHVSAADPHTQYQKESERGVANGYASLDAGVLVPAEQLGTGTPSVEKFLNASRQWVVPTVGGGGIGEVTFFNADGSQDNISLTTDVAVNSLQIVGDLTLGVSSDIYQNTSGNYGWDDLMGVFTIKGAGANDPAYETLWTDGSGMDFEGYTFPHNATKRVTVDYHIHHDYAMGTGMYLHIHWMPLDNTTGTVRWGFKFSVAKGHQQGADSVFPNGATVYVNHNVPVGKAREHHLSEVSLADIIPATRLEPDTVIKVIVFRDTADAADTFNAKVHAWQADLHYQAGRLTTLNKAPNFYA